MMKHILGYRCTLCGAELPYDERMTCPHCGEKGILDIVFDYNSIKKSFGRAALAKDRTNSMWRYAPLMPLEPRDFSPFLRVGWTPLYTANRLSAELGLKTLYLKDDGLNPTASLKAAIEKYGWYNRNAGINPILTEGKKTVALEIAEQLNWEPTDWVAVSVGDGCTIGGVYNGFHDLYALGMIERIPKILGVQSTGCCPFVDAAREHRPLAPAAENTLADSIAVGVPRNPVKAMRAVSASNGAWIAVPDEEILAAMRLAGAKEGVFGEPAGVTALAGVRRALQEGIIKSGETVTAISTGSGLKDVKNALRAAGTPKLCEPDLAALDKSGIL